MAVDTKYFFIISFIAEHQSGLAIVVASTEKQAFQDLKRGGMYNYNPGVYQLIKTECVGTYVGCVTGLLLESYTNAMVAFDAFKAEMSKIVGPQGEPGLSAYDIAVLYGGYVGTIEEFAEGLSNAAKFNVKQGTTAYWNAKTGYIPRDGEIIIYTDYKSITKISPVSGEQITVPVPGIKVGTGNAYVQDLAFVDDWERDQLMEHIQNTLIHVSAEDRLRWNNKLNCENQITGETLILNRL